MLVMPNVFARPCKPVGEVVERGLGAAVCVCVGGRGEQSRQLCTSSPVDATLPSPLPTTTTTTTTTTGAH
jgi:hypothetical protein